MKEKTVLQEYPTHLKYTNGSNSRSNNEQMLEDDEMSLHDLLEILLKGKWIILACFATVIILTAIYTFSKAPEYEAKSLLQVNTDQSSPQLGDLLGMETGFRNVLNEIEVLKSRTIAFKVAEELSQNPSVEGDLSILKETDEGRPPSVNGIVKRLSNRYVTIRPVSQDVDFIEVVAASTNPHEAALIANLYSENYLEYNLTSSRARMTASREFLDEVTETFYTELQSAENSLRSFLVDQNVVAPDEEARQLLEQIADLQRERYQTQLQLGMAKAEIAGLEGELDIIQPGLAQQISSSDNLVIEGLGARIAELTLEREEKIARNPDLKDNPELDPEMVKINSQIQSLRTEMDLRAEQLVADALKNSGITSSSTDISGNKLESLYQTRSKIIEKEIEAKGLEARLEIVNDNLNSFESELQRLPNQEIVLNRLSRTVTTQEQLYITLIEKLQEAKIAEQSELGYVEIIDRAITPGEPVRPNIPLNLILGAIVGLVLGIGTAFVRNALDNKVRKPDDVRKLGMSLIGAIPNLEKVIRHDFDGKKRISLNGTSYDTSVITLLNPLSPIAEGYRRLRTNLQFSDPDRVIRTVVVTSAEPGEGKTVTSVNLAVALAQSGRKTLYLDTDLRRASGHRMLGVQREPGLVDLLFDALPAGMDTFATEIDDLYVIPAGRSIPNPAEVLESKKMEEFMARIRQEFDIIVVDSPPTLAVTDALVVARQCDSTIMVCAANRTNWHALDSSVNMLKDIGAHIAGVVLNRFDASSGSGYGYGYGSGYGYGYGYGYSEYYGETPVSSKKTA